MKKFENISKEIKKARIKIKMSQGDVARKLGFSNQFISKLEGGNSTIPNSKIVILSEILEIKISRIVKAKRDDFLKSIWNDIGEIDEQ